MARKRRFMGLMSGTSCDGVDAALVEITGTGLNMKVKYMDHCSVPYTKRLRRELLEVMAPAKTTTEQLATLHFAVGYAFAACANELLKKVGIRDPNEIAAIGSHGQTICHMPKPDEATGAATLQIGEAAAIAAQCQMTVVSDFRTADLAVGGQGAPLVPWTDYVLFRSPTTARCIQNIGGIANVTYIPENQNIDAVMAFDTGPGCMVMDELVRRASNMKRQFDPQGRFAQRGEVKRDVVQQILALPFFQQQPPKSAGREEFGRTFVSGMLKMMNNLDMSKYDKLATATSLTACSIAHAYKEQLSIESHPAEVILTGGGSKNTTLVSMLKQELPDTTFKLIDEFGIPAQAKECVSFAMLAAACLDDQPANLPRVTGANRSAILGKISRV